MKLSAQNLTKNYMTKTAVKDFSYTFEYGIYGLLGPNGSGKSTLMRMLCDILRPSHGTITLDGENIHKMDERYRDLLGYLPQNFGYYPQFTVNDFLMYFATLKGYEKKEAKIRVQEVLEMVNLIEERKHKINHLSGGMKQRLGIAQALLNDPRILIVDEPTVGLDPKERLKFKSILARCAKDKIVLLSTHIVSDIESLATRILIMKEGKLYQHGSREELIRPLESNIYFFPCREEELDDYRNEMLVISIIPFHDHIMVRCISNTPPREDAKKEIPTLEDLYLSIFRDDM